VGGSVLGGLYIVGRLAERHLVSSREEETRKLLERTRKSTHFSATESTFSNTFISLLSVLGTEIETQLNPEAITSSLRDRPGAEEKIQLWHQLKVLSISRCISLVLGGVHLAILLRTQLCVLAGMLYQQEVQDAVSLGNREMVAERLTSALQEKFLDASHHFVTLGVRRLCSTVREVVTTRTSSLGLQQKLNLTDLEALFKQLLQSYRTEERGIFCDPGAYFLSQQNQPDNMAVESKVRLKQMLADCLDIVDSEDTKALAEQVCGQGLSHLLDSVAEHYSAVGHVQPPGVKLPHKSDDSESDSDSGFVSPASISLPVAKLIPILSAQVSLNNGETDLWLNHLKESPSLRSLGANVYEAFCKSQEPVSSVEEGWGSALYNSVSSWYWRMV